MSEQAYVADNYGGFFSDLDNTKPYIKAAFEGFAGSGKTYTMVQLAIGLHRRIGSTKPIVYFDTEKAGKFLRPIFDEAGVRVLHKESRSLADLKQAMELCRNRGAADILLVDSISHIWENFVEAYKQKKNRTRLQFEDWGVLKPTWKAEFSDPLVRDPYHIFFTGRAAFEYDSEETIAADGKKKREIYKSGVKMRVEGETAYEPDLLVFMERFEDLLEDRKEVYRLATVIKDRSTLIDGRTFKNPTVADFMPAIDRCLLAPVKRAPEAEADAAALIATEEDRARFAKARDILLEEIEALLVETWPGQSAAEKQAKVTALKAAFGSASWTWIKGQRIEVLDQGKAKLEAFIARARAEAEAAA